MAVLAVAALINNVMCTDNHKKCLANCCLRPNCNYFSAGQSQISGECPVRIWYL